MKKEAFLRALDKRLEGMTAEERARALEFCAESIDDRVEDGMAEEDAVTALGDVEDVARGLLADRPLGAVVRERVRHESNAGRVVLLICASPLLLTFFAVGLSVYTALWAAMMWIAGAGEAILSGLASVIGVQVLVAAAGSLIGIVYARYKWVGVLMIALLSGGTAGIFSFLVASRGRDGIALIAGFLSPEGLWLLIAAAVLAAAEIVAAWLHFRRREVKL